MIYPLPAVLVTCGSTVADLNMLTVAWVGTLCTNPAMCYIAVRPERHSYPMIKENMEFTYYGRQRIERRSNILTRELVTAGQLKRVPRTDNNPHGLLITNWRTLLNKDIEQKTKSTY